MELLDNSISLTKVKVGDMECEEYKEITADWEEYIYTFSGERYKLNPYLVEHDTIMRMLIDSEVYVRAEDYGTKENKQEECN